MNDYKEIHPYELELSACRAIGKDWMLICARSGSTVNAMTASWGFLGEIFRQRWRDPEVNGRH